MNLYYFYMNYKNLNGNSDVVWTIGAKFALLKTNSPMPCGTVSETRPSRPGSLKAVGGIFRI